MKFSEMSLEEINKLSYLNLSSESGIGLLVQLIKDEDQKKQLIDVSEELMNKLFSYNSYISFFYDKCLKNSFKLNFITFDGCKYYISLFDFFDNIKYFIGLNTESFRENPHIKTVEELNKYAYEDCHDYLRSVRKDIDEARNMLRVDNTRNEEDIFNGLRNKYCNLFHAAIKLSTENINGSKVARTSDIIVNARKIITNLLFFIKYIRDNCMNMYIDLSVCDIDKDKYAFYIFSENLLCLKNGRDKELTNPIYPVLTYFNETKDTDTSKLFYYGFDCETYKFTKKYTYANFLSDLQEYIKNHKEINCDFLPFDFFEGWSLDEKNEFLNLFTEDTLSNFCIVDPETIFLPNKKSETEIHTERHSSKSDKVFSLLPLEKRNFYAIYKDKIYASLLGKKMFKGYIANVLYNGYIIFEKYDVKDQEISTKAGAAYIMNVHNYNIFSGMSISEIRNYIKTHDCSNLFSKVEFECHKGNWKERLSKYFNEETNISTDELDSFITKVDEKSNSEFPKVKVNEIKVED